ncbi:uncharacterized protein EV422DRAFT_525072 [Fimicolochytrium jonesii]|uniref:uncharacterized protein n=1 Tax=Fimicolochytrium jonesii TaxID=1396493 RepID=UPI0022FE6E1A|nr:uncharacterized protein EV422DRAFT_525072 [Fimicolochytrium jonesii]KAI8822705.1 hypothetical protein EV422DRAFT_525072 [Fimicolochytrium jonesii]
MKATCLLLASAGFASLAVAAPADGVWSAVLPLPLSPISGANTPTGELLMWSGNSPGGWLSNMWDPQGNRTYYSVFSVDDFLAQKPIALQKMVTTEMFCPGTSNLPNGEILINGGTGPIASVIFNPTTKLFRDTTMMEIPRGYQANVVTTSNQVFTVGGSFEQRYGKFGLGGRDGELFTPGANNGKGGWTMVPAAIGNVIGGLEGGSTNPDVQGLYRSDNHAWLFPYANTAGDAMVFHAGPIAKMHVINTSKNTMVAVGNRGNDAYAMNGNAVQYSPGRIYKSGGATAYGDLNSNVGLATSTAAYTIKITALATGGLPIVKAAAPMNNPRALGHHIVLPGGKIFIVGGQTNLYLFKDQTGVLEPELYDPAAGTYQRLAPMKIARNYHSLALLTKYGTVFVGGGGAYPNTCTKPGVAPCTANVHFDAEVFTPPYLSQGQARPTITSVTGAAATYGKVFKLGTDMTVASTNCGGAGCSYELIRISSATHSVANDQLRVPLKTLARSAAGDRVAPWDADQPFIVAGYYYLFAIGANQTPSVATMIQVVR